MSKAKTGCALISLAVLAAMGISGCADPQQNRMTFFVTSVGSGKGADLGGLAGADQHCQSLAQAVGAGNGQASPKRQPQPMARLVEDEVHCVRRSDCSHFFSSFRAANTRHETVVSEQPSTRAASA